MILSRILTITALTFALASCGGGGGRDISGEKVVLPTIGTSGGALSGVQAKKLFGAKSFASTQSPAPFGSYAKGCLAGAAQLPETGPTWQAMRLSR
ncbi:MAG: penicillin-insensitive murein endopeptidase, partial [Sulfitobacter sp.]|nr:penicillin-insensitive murein endopeptidase [Sulfitobacter sp.]